MEENDDCERDTGKRFIKNRKGDRTHTEEVPSRVGAHEAGKYQKQLQRKWVVRTVQIFVAFATLSKI
jgi:hypothetical protein